MTFRPKRMLCAFAGLLLGVSSVAWAGLVTNSKPAAAHSKKASGPSHKSTSGPKLHSRPGIKSSSKTANGSSRTAASIHGSTRVATAAAHAAGAVHSASFSPKTREAALVSVEASLSDGPSAPFLYPAALRSLFQALAAEQNERASNGTSSATVRMLQFGDSHTAADMFTGEMRARLQERFGDGGLGFQFPGHPFAGYHLAGSLRTQTSGWLTEGNRFTALGDGDLGMGGISIATSEPNQSITLQTSCTRLQLHFLLQAGGGRLQFSDNDAPVSTVDTNSESGGSGSTNAVGEGSTAGTFSYPCSAGVHDFAFTTLDPAPVKLLGIVTEQPGVTYECIGINGAVAPLMLRWNEALFADYMRQRAPNLIVLAYGTNEAGQSDEHLETYQADFGRIVDNLHRLVPEASVLVLGPADRATNIRQNGHYVGWHPFLGADRIIAMQKEACRTHGCAFWDTRRRMGGLGSMQQWFAAGWAQPDRTHLNGMGYRSLADALYADLMRAYSVYQQRSETAVQENVHGKAPGNP